MAVPAIPNTDDAIKLLIKGAEVKGKLKKPVTTRTPSAGMAHKDKATEAIVNDRILLRYL